MVYLFCLLIVMTSAIAQPVEGPYEVATVSGEVCSGLSIINPADGAAQVFYSFGDTAYHTMLEFNSGSVGQASVLPGSEIGWNRKLCDAVFEEEGLWDALFYDETGTQNRTRIATNRGDSLSYTQIDAGSNYASEWNSSSCHVYSFLERRPGGGVFAAWVDQVCTWVGFFCATVQPTVMRVTPESAECFCDYGCPELDWENRFVIQPIDSDTYYTVGPGYEPQLCLFDGDQAVWNQYLDCELYPVNMLQTRSGRLLILNNLQWGVGTRIAQIDTTDNCEILFESESESAVLASASHPDYGFAWLEQVGHGVYLWRADTSGQNTRSGILHWHDAWEITVYSLDIADDGTVAVAWCERINNESTIRAAAVDWDTPLAVDNSRLAPIPSSMNLSAYPNPFNSSLTITYELTKTAAVDLAVYNSLGQLVETLFAGEMNAGSHKLVWQPLSGSGVYFVRLSDPTSQKIQKVLYLK